MKRDRLTPDQKEARDEIVERVVSLLKYDLTPLGGAIVIERGEADELRDSVRAYLRRS